MFQKKQLLLIVFFFSCFVNAQNSNQVFDSIVKVSNSYDSDSLKIDFLHKSFFKNCYSNPELSKQIADYSLVLSDKINNDYLKVRSLIRTGIYYDITGKKDSALADYDKALKISLNANDIQGDASIYNNKALIYWNDDDFDEAMNYNLMSLKIFEALNDKNGQASNLNNIALLLTSLKRMEESNQYHRRSLALKIEIKDDYGIGASYTNLSKNFTLLNKLDSAIYFTKKAIKIKKETNDVRGLGIAFNNYAGDLLLIKKPDSALIYFKKADSIYIKLKNTRLRATNAKSMAKAYAEMGNHQKAIECFEISNANLKNAEARTRVEVMREMATSYTIIGKYKKAAENYEIALKLKDSILSQRDLVETQEIFEKYKSAKKEKEILLQRAMLAEQELDINSKNYQLAGLTAFAIILLVLGYLFYNQQKIKNAQLQKEKELQEALVKIETQNRLQEQRLRISRDLHDNIGAQLTFIISSIDNLKYGFDIEDEKLNSKLNSISAFTSETIYELRDTIWAMNKNKITFEDLQARISNFIDKAQLVSKDLKFQFNVSKALDQRQSFSSIEGMNIYRVIQEAIHNAIKYSKAEMITVTIEKLELLVQITIADDGIGFNSETVTNGNGLLNIKKRVADIGGELKINSQLKAGTQVVITL